jgi:toxin ParE1/3/4
MGHLRFSRQALQDLVEIGDYIAQDSPANAARFVMRLEQHCELLASRPLIGRARNEVRPGLRSIKYNRYVIFYHITEEDVEIVRVLHNARDLDKAMKDA